MPTVPRAQRTVGTQIFQSRGVSTQAPTGAFTGDAGLGQAVIDTAQDVIETTNKHERLLKREAEKAENAEVAKKRQDATKIKNDIIYGTRDEKGKVVEPGFLEQRRADSTTNFDAYQEKYKQRVKQIREELGSQGAKDKFDRITGDIGVELDGQMNRHAFKEMQEHDREQTEASIAIQQENAVLNYREMGMADENGEAESKVQESIKEQQVLIEAYGERMGLSREEIDQMKVEQTSKTHMGVMRRMIANNEDMLAKDYLKDLRGSGQVDGETISQMEGIVQGASVLGESQRQADAIIGEGLGMKDSIAEARKIEDPQVRDKTVQRVRNRFNEKKAAEQEDSRREYETLARAVEQKGSLEGMTEEYLSLSASDRSSIDRRLAQVASGKQVVTDWKVYTDLKMQAARPETRDKFLKTSLMKSRDKLNNSEFKELVKLQSRLAENDATADEDLRGFMSDQATVNKVLDVARIKNDREKAAANQAIQQRALDWERRNKKRIPQDELRRIAENMVIDVEVEGKTFYDPDKKLFEVKQDERVIVNFDDIPENEKRMIGDFLKRRNVPFTEEKAVELYKRRINEL